MKYYIGDIFNPNSYTFDAIHLDKSYVYYCDECLIFHCLNV
jgi:hypothetical protein